MRLMECISLQTVFHAWYINLYDFRGNNLWKVDAEDLRYALLIMPNLESLDISDNPIEDDGIRSVDLCSPLISSIIAMKSHN